MESITNTELAVLGLVAEGPRHGYQVEQDIQRRGMRSWTEIGFSSIYYVLNKLEAAGWLGPAEPEPPAPGAGQGGKPRRGGPARRVYTLTAAGRAVYQAAVRERLARPRPHSGDFELGLANLPALSPADVRAALETNRAGLRARAAAVFDKRQEDQENLAAGGLRLEPHVQALFDYSLALMRAELDWINAYLDAE